MKTARVKFRKEYDNEWHANTPIGCYVIIDCSDGIFTLTFGFATSLSIEEIANEESTFEEMIQKAQRHFDNIINYCIEEK